MPRGRPRRLVARCYCSSALIDEPSGRRAHAHRLRDSCQHQRLPSVERHDAVVAARHFSDPEEQLRPRFRTDRIDRAGESAHGVAAAARRRDVHGPPSTPVLPGRRHELHARRSAAARNDGDVRAAAPGSGARRRRLVGISPRVVTDRTPRVGRTARVRSIVLPDGRQPRLLNRPVTRRVHRPAPRPAEHRLVLAGGSRRDRDSVARRPMVFAASGHWRRQTVGGCDAYVEPSPGVAGDGRADRARLLEIRLPVESGQLLHVLPHSQIRPLGAKRAAAPVRLPCRRRDWHLRRRPGRRSHRPQVRDLGIDPGRAAFQPGAALRQPVLDRRT